MSNTLLSGAPDAGTPLCNARVLVAGLATALSVFAIRAEDVVKASSFGYDAADATACLQKALDSRHPRIVVDRQEGGWNVRSLKLRRPGLELVLEPGVVIRAKRGAFADKHGSLLDILPAGSNVVIRGGAGSGFAMRKADYADSRRYAFSEDRHAVALRRCRNVTLRDLTISDAGGDGIYVWHPTDTLIENVTCSNALRNCMSVISAERLTVRNSRFVAANGTAPMSGIDIEPNNPKDSLEDILIERCTLADNASAGLYVILLGLDATARPVSITVRDCEMVSNAGSGLVTYAARAGAPVSGRIAVESCRLRGNGRNALHLTNQEERGAALAFADCTFDGRGGARTAVEFGNTQISEDLAGVSFADCRVLSDRPENVCGFVGMTGAGVTDVRGVWTVDDGTGERMLDLVTLKAEYPSRPDLRRFAAAKVDFAALRPVTTGTLEKPVTYPFIRQRFTFVQYVPGAGTHPLRFLLRPLNRAKRPKLSVRVRDGKGTDLGTFTMEELSHDYEIRQASAAPNVYLFEIQCGLGALASVESRHPGQGVLFDDPVNLFGFSETAYYFSVPGSATEVCAELMPQEEMAAELEDGVGALVDTLAYSYTGKVLRAKRTATVADETWAVFFSRVREDGLFRLGAPAVPIATTDPAAVLMTGTEMRPRTKTRQGR